MLRQEMSVGDLTLSQWSALATVEESGPLRIGELAEREHMSAPTATRVAAALEERGLVTRVVDAADRRSTLLSLAPQGAAMLQQVRRERTAQLAGRLARLDPADVARLMDALPVLEQLTRA
jgi:DNA-binding MarR family transcriptional regulator